MAHSHSSGGSTPWFAFLMGALIVVALFIAYSVYVGQGLDLMQTVEAPRPVIERPDLPDLPTPLPRA
ncbi:MAG: hypothetical protein AB7J28_06445 [Hyphomonadaceae bacterium]